MRRRVVALATTARLGDTRVLRRMWNSARRRLTGRIPAPDFSPELVARLADERADVLLDLVCDLREPWWRRRPCALALRGRVPPAGVPRLLARVCDVKDVAEVRRAILEALADAELGPHAGELLAWLRAAREPEVGHDMLPAILHARARLGDASAAAPLAELAADPWTHRRTAGEAAVDALIAAVGLDAVLAALEAADLPALAFTAATPARRLLGVRLLDRSGGDIVPALADADVIVARQAHLLLVGSSRPDDALWAVVAAHGPAAAAWTSDECPRGPAGACMWALCVLHARGRDIGDAWRALGSPRVSLPIVPEDVRRAIVAEYAPGQRQTDPRWLLEAAVGQPFVPPDESALLAQAHAALAAAGLEPRPPRSAGELHNQGDGTYYEIAFAGGAVSVSALGPFVAFEDDDRRARTALVAAGFRVIDPALAGCEVTGLHVYFFGRRDPLCVGDLLFYWQD
ncbi:hypothetical protein SAMN02745121_05275 [Nannocystis exedens]|uniref:Uncharacterized protein n=1 Tax=Nannocystis exedens TaxID=54 RepID=A0A1I2CV18_9BACT|nr:hypothetical protein [Nannocystis exedens]PCC68601.1 hypothetical protein NAEX_01617 [Nannocystis exedens]SFE72151.1 hypothetical protein SAMN02745121_05275 [Nannocystis exedens]